MPAGFGKMDYGVARETSGQMMMPEIMAMMTHTLESHRDDRITSDELRDYRQNA